MRLLLVFQFIILASCSDIFNVGTVLWRKSDGVKHCWSASEKDLLIARRIMQGLLPEPELVDFTTTHAISTLLEYFRMCFEIIKEGSSGETQEHLLRSLADAVGGYLKRIALPISRQLFYSGRITFEETSTIHLLYDDLKLFLKTSGEGWKSPEASDRVPIAVSALEVNTDGDGTACDDLIFEETSHLQNFLPNNKTTFKRSGENISDLDMDLEPERKPTLGKLPLPRLDDSEKPTAMAIPLKDSPLVSLSSKESAFLITKYYSNAIKCIAARSESKDVDLANFNTAMYGWLANEVLPHLNDDFWFIGFGGVLRAVQAIKATGVDTSTVEAKNRNDRFFFVNGVAFGNKIDSKKGLSWFKKNYDFLKSHSGAEIFVLAFFVMTLFLAVVFIKCLRKDRQPSSLFSSLGERVSSAVTSLRSLRKTEKTNSRDTGSPFSTSYTASNIRSSTNSSKETHSYNSRPSKYYQELPCSSDFISRLPRTTNSYPTMKHSPDSSSSTDGDAAETESAGTSDTNSESAH